MSQSTNLHLPYIAAGQAQKHVTVNEALLRLDALVQANAISRVTTSQPASPSDGEVYILPPGKTGASWSGMSNHALAYYRDGVWEQLAPRAGWTVFLRDENRHVVFSGSAWAAVASLESAGFRNRLVNPAFAINQRALASVSDDAYCFDRWYALTQSGAIGVSALTDPEAGFPTGVRLTQSQASAQRIGLAQIVESADIRDLRSVAAAMAARVRCSSAQVVRMAILEWTGAADAVTSDVVADWTSGAYTSGNFFIASVNVVAIGATSISANAWTNLAPISGVFTAALNNAIVFVWSEAALAQNVTIDLDQVQLEAGVMCGPFVRRPIGEELALCQRYLEKGGFGAGATPAAGASSRRWQGGAWSTGNLTGQITFLVHKRAAPAVTFYRSNDAGAAATGTWNYLVGSWSEATSISATSANNDGFLWDLAKAGAFTASSSYLAAGGWTADCEL